MNNDNRNGGRRDEPLQKRYLNERKQENYDKYERKRMEVKKISQNSKENSWIEFGNKLSTVFREKQKMFYNILMTKTKPNMLKDVKNKSGNILTNKNEIVMR